MLSRERSCCPVPAAFPLEHGRADEMLAASSHFIIALPGQMGQSWAFSARLEVQGQGQLPHFCAGRAGKEIAGGEGPGPSYPHPPVSAASAKLLQTGAGISSSPPSAAQRPLQ